MELNTGLEMLFVFTASHITNGNQLLECLERKSLSQITGTPEIKISLVMFSLVCFSLEKLNRRKNRAGKQISVYKISGYTEK